MTDRINAFVVILEKDIRDDDAEPIIDAIRQLRGVLDVQPHVSNVTDMMAETRARTDMIRRLHTVIKEFSQEG